MKVKNNLWSALVGMVFFIPTLTGQYHINFKIDDYTNDTLIIGYYYGEKQLVKDTVTPPSRENLPLRGMINSMTACTLPC